MALLLLPKAGLHGNRDHDLRLDSVGRLYRIPQLDLAAGRYIDGDGLPHGRQSRDPDGTMLR